MRARFLGDGPFLLCPYVVAGTREPLWHLFYGGTNPIHEGSLLDLITFPRPQLLRPSPWVLAFQQMNFRGTQTFSPRYHVPTEAKIRIIWLQTKQCRPPPESGWGKARILLWSLGTELSPADALISAQEHCFQTPDLQNSERTHFCCFKPLNLSRFVMAAPGN